MMNVLSRILRLVIALQLNFVHGAAELSTADKSRMKRLNEAVFDYIARESALVWSVTDFEQYMLSGLNERDRKDIVSRLKGVQRFPVFHRKGSALVVSGDGPRIEIRVPDMRKPEFEVNGLRWVYNPKQPLVPQIEALTTRLKNRKFGSLILDQLLPTAEGAADPISWTMVGVMALGTVIGALSAPISDMANRVYCMVSEYFSWSVKMCLDFKAAERQALFKEAPKMDAVSNQSGSDRKNILAKFDGQTFKCPSDNDGKEREYRGTIHAVTIENGKTVPVSDPIFVKLKFTAEGVPTDAIFTKSELKDDKSEGQALVVHVAYDAKE